MTNHIEIERFWEANDCKFNIMLAWLQVSDVRFGNVIGINYFSSITFSKLRYKIMFS